jgi:hypothetical protein
LLRKPLQFTGGGLLDEYIKSCHASSNP